MRKNARQIVPLTLAAAAIIATATIATPIANAAETANTGETPEEKSFYIPTDGIEKVPTEETEEPKDDAYVIYDVSFTIDGTLYEHVTADDYKTVWEFVQETADITEDGNTTVTITDASGDEVDKGTLLRDLDGAELFLNVKSFTTPEPEPDYPDENQNGNTTDGETQDGQDANTNTATDTNTNANESESEDDGRRQPKFTLIVTGDPNGELGADFDQTYEIKFLGGQTYREALENYPEETTFAKFILKDEATGETIDFDAQAEDSATIRYERLARATYILNATPDGETQKHFIELDGMEAFDTAARDTSDGDLQLPTLTDPSGEYVCVGYEAIIDTVESPSFLPNQHAYVSEHYPDGVPDTEGAQIAETATIETAKSWKLWLSETIPNGGTFTYGNGKIGYYGEVEIWTGWKSNHPVGIFRAVWEKAPKTPEPETPEEETPEAPETPQETPQAPQEETPQETPEETPEAPETPETPEEDAPELVQTGNDRLTTASTAGAAAVLTALAGAALKATDRFRH